MSNEWRTLSTLQDIAEAQKNGDEIECCEYNEWVSWFGEYWEKDWRFRARPAQPKMKQVKMEAWLSGSRELRWFHEDAETPMLQTSKWTRVPTEDKVIEIPE